MLTTYWFLRDEIAAVGAKSASVLVAGVDSNYEVRCFCDVWDPICFGRTTRWTAPTLEVDPQAVDAAYKVPWLEKKTSNLKMRDIPKSSMKLLFLGQKLMINYVTM